MPLFRFHFEAPDWTLHDNEGVELPSAVAAMEYAMKVAQELGRNKRPSALAGQFVIAVDQREAEIFKMAVTDDRSADEPRYQRLPKGS